MFRFFSILLFISSLQPSLIAQNEAKVWYFGYQAGLNFTTMPPTVLSTGAMSAFEGCGSIADASGNLLFYTNGTTIWDKTHAIMANGSGLNGQSSTTQSGVIVKQPGSSNIYFVFTLGASGTGSLNFSTVDMSLALGNGSVTIKNTLLATMMTEKLAAVRHCNGIDTWVLAHDQNSNVFRCYLVTAAGVNLSPVLSPYGTIHTVNGFGGYMKFSPNGRKLGLAIHAQGAFEIYDFDNATGVVSNSLSLTTTSLSAAYGCEFSPDGSKFYGTREFGFNGFYQWDLCAGTGSAIVASQYTQATTGQIMAMQLATDGKIYIARNSQTVLAVIDNPNALGAACNFNFAGQSIAPKTSGYGLPNFISSIFKTPQAFTFSVHCASVTFSAPASVNSGTLGCSAMGFPSTGIQWSFGDPTSGSSNSSFLSQPTHTYSAPGIYTTQLIVYNACANDTLRSIVSVPGVPSLSVTGNFNLCKGEKRAYIASGANTYIWSGNITSNAILLSPTITTTYSVSGTNTLTGCSSVKFFTITVFDCIGKSEYPDWVDEFKFFPNPVNDLLRLKIPVDLELVLRNTIGKVILSESLKAGSREINLSSLSEGMYILKVRDKNGSEYTYRLMKTKAD